MRAILSNAKLGSQPGGRPPAAVEISPEGVLAAVRRGGPTHWQTPLYAFQALPAGAIVPGIGEPNLRDPEAVATAIRSALEQVSPPTRAVTLVLPDTVVRVFVLDFDSLPQRLADADLVLRFRLRKMIPFDAQHAGLSYQVLKRNESECKVLAAVLPGPVLAEYEHAIRAAGYQPGAVLPSTLASLQAIDSMEASLTANLTSCALTTSITNGQDLLLYRTVELPREPGLRLDEVQRAIAVAAAYYEDKLMTRAQRLHYAGIGDAEAFAGWIDNPELAVVDLTPRPEGAGGAAIGNTSVAGVTGAQIGRAHV